MEQGGESDEGLVRVDVLLGGPPSVQGSLLSQREGRSTKSPLLHRGYRVDGVVEDRLGAVGIGEEVTQSREAGSTAGRDEGQEGFQLRGGDTRPVHVALGVEVEGQVTDGVQADLDCLELIRP
ncbi:hypothetical protein ABZ079_36050 [Streptomyces sp. NPDC006314]|uniref:hypothetical protein n=1 Tax=Streptomyces sp. NPDC006314 TaxID=3154475 RepID=UPI0033A1DCBE